MAECLTRRCTSTTLRPLLRSYQMPVELLGGGAELHDQVAGQVLRLDLAALFAPEPDQGGLVASHDDPGVGAADESPSNYGFGSSYGTFHRNPQSCLGQKFTRTPSAPSTIFVYYESPAVSTKNVDVITPSQSRGARGLLEMTQTELATRSNLGLSTIVDFEKSRRQVSMEAITAIKAALERAGIEFISKNGGGPGVRLKSARTR